MFIVQFELCTPSYCFTQFLEHNNKDTDSDINTPDSNVCTRDLLNENVSKITIPEILQGVDLRR